MLRLSLLLTVVLGLSSWASAHPHGEADTETDTVEIEVKGKDTATVTEIIRSMQRRVDTHKPEIDRAAKTMKLRIERNADDISEHAADDLSDLADGLTELADSELFGELAEMFADLAEDVEIDTDKDVTVLRFDGRDLARIDSRDENKMTLSGLGQNLSLERETVVEDGETRTRIVIEMDGGEDLSIDLPE